MDDRMNGSTYDRFDKRNDNGSEIDLTDILDTLWKRKKLIGIITALCIIIGIVVVLLIPRKYESRTTLLFLPPVSSQVASDAAVIRMFSPATYFTIATATDLLQSVIDKAYAKEPADERPTVLQMREKKMEGELSSPETPENKASLTSENPMDQIRSQVTMTVAFIDKDPEVALDAVKTWMDLFIKQNSRHFIDRAGESTVFLKESLDKVTTDLTNKENELLAYQRNASIPLLKSQIEIAQKLYAEFLAKYNQDVAKLPIIEAKAKAEEALLSLETEKKSLSKGISKEALWNFLSKNMTKEEFNNLQGLNVVEEFENPEYNKLKSNLASTKIALSELRAEISDLKIKIDTLKKEHEEMNARLLQMETDIARLQREKATLQDSYTDLSKRYQNARITAVEMNDPIRIMERPILARKPLPRGGMKIVALATRLGLFVGCMAALLSDMYERKRASEAHA